MTMGRKIQKTFLSECYACANYVGIDNTQALNGFEMSFMQMLTYCNCSVQSLSQGLLKCTEMPFGVLNP